MSRMSGGRLLAAVAAVVFLLLVFNNERHSALLPYLSSLPNKASFYHSTPERKELLRERMALSERSWQKSVEERDRMAKQHRAYPSIPFFPVDFGEYPYTIWDFFTPTWTCPLDVQRVGRLGDGGKWVCGMSVYESLPVPERKAASADVSQASVSLPQDGLVVYSFGINDDSSFEADILDRVPSARIWGYDFSVEGWGPQIKPEQRSRTYFKKVGLGKQDSPASNPPFWTLPSLMKENGHEYIDILKIDIEGSEYDALDTVMDAFEPTRSASGQGILPVGQIMIELHLGDGISLDGTSGGAYMDFPRFLAWWERLEKMGMRPVWMEINLLAVTLTRAKSDPRCTEFVWVNAKDERNVLWNA